MKAIFLLSLALMGIFPLIVAQASDTPLPFRQIPEAPEAYTAGSVTARMVDALGFRYYWATEGLSEKDLAFRPSEEARSTRETLEHIFGLSQSIANATQQKANVRGEGTDPKEMSFAQLRANTLQNAKIASDILRTSEDKQLNDYQVVFQNGENRYEFPFWNLINGQISDAINHVGQIVSFRRSSGNPIDKRVNVFRGTVRE